VYIVYHIVGFLILTATLLILYYSYKMRDKTTRWYYYVQLTTRWQCRL